MFKRQFKAIAVIDETFEAEETGKTFANPEQVTVIVFSVQNLKKLYEDNRNNILKSV